MRPVVGRRCGEVDEGGVRRGASTVGASGGGDEWRIGEGEVCCAHAEVGLDERVYAGDGGRRVVGKWAVSQKAVHLASTCRGGVIQKEGSPRWQGKEASQPHTVGRAEARSEGGSDVETWAARRRSRRGPRGRSAAGGRPRGRRSAECVHTGQRVRAGRRSVPQ